MPDCDCDSRPTWTDQPPHSTSKGRATPPRFPTRDTRPRGGGGARAGADRAARAHHHQGLAPPDGPGPHQQLPPRLRLRLRLSRPTWTEKLSCGLPSPVRRWSGRSPPASSRASTCRRADTARANSGRGPVATWLKTSDGTRSASLEECTASGVPREASGPGDPALSPRSQPPRAPRAPRFHPPRTGGGPGGDHPANRRGNARGGGA